MPLDVDQFADVVATAIQSATAPLLARIAALETRGAVVGRDGRDGMIGPAGEKGLDGAPGRDGHDGAPGEPGARGEQGAQGEQGPAGEVGPQGPPGVSGEPGASGERGLQGEQGPAGERGPEGPAGRDGINGKDGAPGLHGKDGVDGRDGLNGTLENLKVVQSPDLRTITLCFKATGEPIEGGTFRLPVVLDQGVYKAGTTYQAGDGVTWAGSFWIAQAETDAQPADGATAWRLSVKRGREGKSGRDGKDLRDAPVVSLGGRAG